MFHGTNLKEIEEQFDGEYVLLENPEVDEHFEVIRGVVRYHSFSRDEIYKAANQVDANSIAVLFNGEVPDNIRLIL